MQGSFVVGQQGSLQYASAMFPPYSNPAYIAFEFIAPGGTIVATTQYIGGAGSDASGVSASPNVPWTQPGMWTCNYYWSDSSGALDSQKGSTTFTVTPNTYTLTTTSNAGGSVSPSGSTQQAVGSTIPITATANTGYILSDWTVTASNPMTGNSTSSTYPASTNPLRIQMNGNTTASAVFQRTAIKVTFQFSPPSVVYSGTAQGTTIYPSDPNATYTVSYSGGFGPYAETGNSTPLGPINAGSYTVTATATGMYQGAGSATFTINPKPVTFAFSNLSQAYSGRTFSASVSASDPRASYSTSLSGGPNAGAYPVSATAYGNYTGTGSDRLTITPKPVTFAFGDLSQHYDGSTKHATITASDASATYAASLTGGPAPGDYRVSATATGNYSGSGSATLTILSPIATTFAFENTAFTYDRSSHAPTVLPSPGEASYTTAGTSSAINAGDYSFTATATGDYSGSGLCRWSIARKPVTFSIGGDLTPTYDGTAKAATITPSDGAATYTVAYSGSGGTAYGSQTTPPTGAGSYTVTATATGNYIGGATGTLTIARAIPSISWATPAPTTYGTALTTAQLNTTADTPGTFAYVPAAGTILGAGTHPLQVTFTPSDPANHEAVAASVPLVVAKARLTVTAHDQTKRFGAPLPPLTYTIAGYVAGDSGAVLTGSPELTTTATAASDVGTYPIAVGRGTLATANYEFDPIGGTLAITAAPVTFTFSDLTHGYDGAVHSATVRPSDPAAAYRSVLTGGPDTGEYSVTAAATGNWTGSGSAILSITPAAQVVTLTPTSHTAFAGQSVTFTAAGGHTGYAWGGDAMVMGAANPLTLTFATPGTRSVSVSCPADRNYTASNTATVTVEVVANLVVTSLTPLESSYTVNDPASPLDGQSYPRIWQNGGWTAYLGRAGVRFNARAVAWPAVQRVELQGKPPGASWNSLATESPTTAATTADVTFNVQLGAAVPGQPLVPLSYQEGNPQTGQWSFRARVQDSNGTWSDFCPEVPVSVILPITSKTVSGQTVPPAGDLGAWFTASPVRTFSFQFWIP